jgi:hypothetical protein
MELERLNYLAYRLIFLQTQIKNVLDTIQSISYYSDEEGEIDPNITNILDSQLQKLKSQYDLVLEGINFNEIQQMEESRLLNEIKNDNSRAEN